MTQEKRPLVAMVALETAEPLDLTRFPSHLMQAWPDAPKIGRIVQGEQAGMRMFTMELGSEQLIISHVPAPIPWSDLEGPCQAAWYYWPEAAQALSDHESHLLVLLKSDEEDRILPAMRLTTVLAAMISMFKTVGVLWGGSGRVHEPGPFAATVAALPPGVLPVELWIGFTLLQENDDTRSIYTDGLEEFGFSEIEVHRTHRDPQHLYSRVFDITHYVLKKNVHFKDGETIGFSEEDRVQITYGASRGEPDNRVAILDM